MTHAGHLIVVEGPDGVGKSTLTALLVDQLRDVGVPCYRHAFPGNEPGTLGSLVYRLHHESEALGVGEIAPVALQATHIAAHLDAIERVFLPRLAAGENILLDRFWWSTMVYGIATGVSRDVLEGLIGAERRCWGTVQPLVGFLIDRPRPWREGEDTPMWHRLAQQYRELAAEERTRHRVEFISNDGSPQRAVDQMVALVASMVRSTHVPDARADSPRNPQLNLHLPSAEPSPPRASSALSIGRIKGLKPTKVFDSYWRFAVERQEVFFRRLEGATPPWSADPILREHRFTNAYRASDRVSQYLIRNVQYAGAQEPDAIFFRTILFKLFNRISTWELLEGAMGGIEVADFSPARYEQVLDRAMNEGQRIYSAAYIMPAAKGRSGGAKHAGHLRLLERMLRDELPQRLGDAPSLARAFELIRAYPMMGDFLAYQYAIDLNYSTLLNFSEMEFVVPGPGARSGLRKCFRNLGGLSEAEVIRLVTESQLDEFESRDLKFRDLWGRSLQLIDCQNLFCEVDKYARVAHPEMTDEGGRTRIKQVFRPAGRPTLPWYPPKWGLNERIAHGQEDARAPDPR